MGHRRSEWTTLLVLLVALVQGCSAPTEPSTPTVPAAPPPTPAPTPLPDPPTRRQLSGRVLDQDGAPVARASVMVTYASAGGPSNPPSHCPMGPQFCRLATRTNDAGEYSVEFESVPWPGRGFGFVDAFRDGYEVDVQWVPTGPSPTVRDLRLRSTRRISAGESIAVRVDGASSLCTDLEDNWALEHRCEIVVIQSGAGLLHVEARTVAGQPAPFVFWYTTGNYSGFITRPAPGTLAIPAGGGTYRILVGIPEGTPAQQFTVTTSLR